MTATAETVCGNRAFNCLCDLPAQHNGDHACECGGAWRYHGDEFYPTAFPDPWRGGAARGSTPPSPTTEHDNDGS